MVLTRDSVIASLAEVTVAPVTAHIREIPSEVELSRDDGLPRECAVNCDHLRTVPRGRLGGTISRLSREKMVRFALNLD